MKLQQAQPRNCHPKEVPLWSFYRTISISSGMMSSGHPKVPPPSRQPQAMPQAICKIQRTARPW